MLKKYSTFCVLLLFSFCVISQNNQKEESQNKFLDSLNTSNVPPKDRIRLLENNIEDFSDPISKIEAYITLAESYSEIEVYDLAYEYNSIAVKIADSIKNHEKLGYLYKNLGKIQLRIGNYESSLDFHKKSLEAFQISGDTIWKLIAKGNVAVVQSKIGPIEEAIITLKELSNQKSLSQKNRATTLMTLGNIYLTNLEIPLEAIKLYQAALDLLSNDSNEVLHIMLHQNICESYIALKEYDKALKHNQKSELLLSKKDNLELWTTLHQFYAEIYEATSLHQEAYKNLKLHQKYKDSLANTDTQLKIANITTAKEIEKHKADVELQKNTIDALEQEEIINSLRITILLISIILITGLTYWFIKRSKQKIKLLKTEKSHVEGKLEFNKSKIEKMALNIATSQEYVASFSDKIKDTLTRITDKKSNEEVTKLLRDLQSYKIINDNKKELKTYLNKINDEYLYNLAKNYPTLTKEEQNLCSLIFLNLKNKDIANLLNLSVRSIENKRYRIRKKMNLSTNESLSDTLNSL